VQAVEFVLDGRRSLGPFSQLMQVVQRALQRPHAALAAQAGEVCIDGARRPLDAIDQVDAIDAVEVPRQLWIEGLWVHVFGPRVGPS